MCGLIILPVYHRLYLHRFVYITFHFHLPQSDNTQFFGLNSRESVIITSITAGLLGGDGCKPVEYSPVKPEAIVILPRGCGNYKADISTRYRYLFLNKKILSISFAVVIYSYDTC